MLTLQMTKGSALCNINKQFNELSDTPVVVVVAAAVMFTFVLSSGSFLRYSKSDFGGIHVQRTSLILCGSFMNMILFI